MEIAAAHRTYALRDNGIGAAIVNFLINGAIAWLMFRTVAAVPLWGQQSIAGDTIGTGFFLPFITCLIVTPLTLRQVQSGSLPRPAWSRLDHPLLARLPSGAAKRGALLGAIGALVAAPPVVLAFLALGVGELALWRFIAFKAIFAAILAALVSPLIALAALGDASTSPPRSPG